MEWLVLIVAVAAMVVLIAFRRPASRSAVKVETAHPTPDVTRRKLMIRIRSRNYYGSYAMSTSGHFTLAWRNRDLDGGQVGGYRQEGHGDYLLLEQDEVVAEGRLERPNQGKVANNGTFILHDWHFGNALRGTFHAFARDGREIIRTMFEAKLLNNALSSDGRFAVCQMFNSDHADGNTLAMFNLLSGAVVWQTRPPTDPANEYEFDTDKSILRLVYRNGVKYAYSMNDGSFLELDRWETDRVDRAGPFELVRIGQEQMAATSGEIDSRSGAEVVVMLKKAIASGLDRSPYEHARALRTLGELWEAMGDLSKALDCYKRAIALDSRVGVRRKVQALKKILGQ